MRKSVLTFVLAIASVFSCSPDDQVVVSGTSVTYGDETYETVVIGTQTWFKRNLNYDLNDGKCYEDKLPNCDKYGKLYDWATANIVCPSGWRLPSNADWDKLIRYVDGMSGSGYIYDSPTAGRYLKATSGWYLHWGSGNGEDKFGFSALPGGYDKLDGSFGNAGYVGCFWSASEYESNSNNAYNLCMHNDDEYVRYNYYYDKSYLFSVRCIKDE